MMTPLLYILFSSWQAWQKAYADANKDQLQSKYLCIKAGWLYPCHSYKCMWIFTRELPSWRFRIYQSIHRQNNKTSIDIVWWRTRTFERSSPYTNGWTILWTFETGSSTASISWFFALLGPNVFFPKATSSL